ncbi:N-acetylmuramate alpha-1-phosphate uridylyltransferase MurU [Eionea flava]
MKAMILAAGRGERMRPLTNNTPKPLLPVNGKPLIVYHLEKLSSLGVSEVIINTAYLGEKIIASLGDGERWGLRIVYSQEPYALETGGALNHALSLLGDEPFLLVNGDVWCDLAFSRIASSPLNDSVAHLWLVNNPDHNLDGDFSLDVSTVMMKQDVLPAYTFSGLALVHPKMIADYPQRREAFALKEVFLYWISKCRLSGSLFEGDWCDVGTPERLVALEQSLKEASV